MRILIVMGLASVLSAALAGCGTTSPNSSEASVQAPSTASGPNRPVITSDFSRSKLIAADFVATIAQIPATDPTTTILHTDQPTTRFGELLLSSLQKAGFDLRIDSESSDDWLVYSAVRDQQLSADGNQVYTFIVAAGEVKLKRSYEVDEYGVRPASGMFVRGANITDVVSDDSLFSIRKPDPESAPLAPSEPKPATKLPPNIADLNNLNSDGAVINPTPAPEVVKSNKLLTAEEKLELEQLREEETTRAEQLRELEESVAALALLDNDNGLVASDDDDAYALVPNMFETRESRYEEIFQDYDVVDTEVLLFPDDSLLLGRQNKQVIQRYAQAFNPETDVMSVVGCSHGTSKLKNGNGYLANGRAFRVKEEFLAIGLASGKVLEEGCWADEEFENMPARGVLLQHKRLSEN